MIDLTFDKVIGRFSEVFFPAAESGAVLVFPSEPKNESSSNKK